MSLLSSILSALLKHNVSMDTLDNFFHPSPHLYLRTYTYPCPLSDAIAYAPKVHGLGVPSTTRTRPCLSS